MSSSFIIRQNIAYMLSTSNYISTIIMIQFGENNNRFY